MLNTEENEEDLDKLGEEKITLGNGLIEALNQFAHVDGVTKIRRKIASEISSLQKV